MRRKTVTHRINCPSAHRRAKARPLRPLCHDRQMYQVAKKIISSATLGHRKRGRRAGQKPSTASDGRTAESQCLCDHGPFACAAAVPGSCSSSHDEETAKPREPRCRHAASERGRACRGDNAARPVVPCAPSQLFLVRFLLLPTRFVRFIINNFVFYLLLS